MVDGVPGVPGATALGPVVEECSIPSVPVITLCLRMGENTARERGSSTAHATQKCAQTPMVRNFGDYIEIIHFPLVTWV